jgi:hypothetical protein
LTFEGPSDLAFLARAIYIICWTLSIVDLPLLNCATPALVLVTPFSLALLHTSALLESSCEAVTNRLILTIDYIFVFLGQPSLSQQN